MPNHPIPERRRHLMRYGTKPLPEFRRPCRWVCVQSNKIRILRQAVINVPKNLLNAARPPQLFHDIQARAASLTSRRCI